MLWNNLLHLFTLLCLSELRGVTSAACLSVCALYVRAAGLAALQLASTTTWYEKKLSAIEKSHKNQTQK